MRFGSPQAADTRAASVRAGIEQDKLRRPQILPLQPHVEAGSPHEHHQAAEPTSLHGGSFHHEVGQAPLGPLSASRARLPRSTAGPVSN